MPLYEYQCARCGRFEIIHKFSDDPLRTCPTCGDEVQKMPSAPAIQFKGTGWYITDYARKGGGGEKKDSGGDAGEKKSSGGDAGEKKGAGGDGGSSKSEGSKASTKTDPA